MTRHPWTPAELALLAGMFPHCHSADVAAWLGRSVSSVNCAAYTRRLGKTDEYLASDTAARIKRGQQHPNMIATRFQPGQKPWNTGTHYVAGGRSPVTRFKPGLALARVAARRFPRFQPPQTTKSRPGL